MNLINVHINSTYKTCIIIAFIVTNFVIKIF